MNKGRFARGCASVFVIAGVWGCADNEQSPTAVTTLTAATEDSSLELEQPSKGTRGLLLPDANVQRVPIRMTLTDSNPLKDTLYRPSKAELEAIQQRLQPLLVRTIDVRETDALYATSLSSFQRVPYLSRSVTDSMPSGAKRVFRGHYQAGRIRCVFKIEEGQEQLYQRVFYDEAGAPAVVCEHLFQGTHPKAVHYLQYDQRGYLARCLEFWADANTGLRHRASYVIRASDGYQQATSYWFTETGEFRERYVHNGNEVFEQTYRDDQPRRASTTPFQLCINRPREYGMQPLFPTPDP